MKVKNVLRHIEEKICSIEDSHWSPEQMRRELRTELPEGCAQFIKLYAVDTQMWLLIVLTRSLSTAEKKNYKDEILELGNKLTQINIECINEDTVKKISKGYEVLEILLTIAKDENINNYITHLLRATTLSVDEIHTIRTILNEGTSTIGGIGKMKPKQLLHHIPSLYNGYGSDWSCLLRQVIDDAKKYAVINI